MYETTWRDILISGLITLGLSLAVAALMSAVLVGISVAAAWTRSDLIFKASLAFVIQPQALVAPLIYKANRYKRTYVLDVVGLLCVPLLIPPTVLKISQLVINKLFNLQIPSDLSVGILMGSYIYLTIGLFVSLQHFLTYVERPYFGYQKAGHWKKNHWRRKKW